MPTFEGMPGPKQEQPKTEVELLKEELAKTEEEFGQIDPGSPEYDWLKDKLVSLQERLKALSKPELRTKESYEKAAAEADRRLEEGAVDMSAEAEMESDDGEKKEKAA